MKRGLSEDLLLRFEYKTEYVDKVRTIKNRKWDLLKRCWSVPNNTESIEQIIKMFDTNLIVDYSGLVVTNTLKGKAWEQEIIKGLGNALKIRGYSPKTRKAYIGHIRRFINFYEDDPSGFQKKDVDKYLLHLLEVQEHSHSYVNQSVSAIKFFYNDVFKRKDIIIDISRPKKEMKLPEVLSQKEIIKLLHEIENIKHRAILFLVYSAGLRVGEVVRLKVADIDSDRMLIRISQGKGRKDRYSILSQIALGELRTYARKYKPDNWLFPGADTEDFLTERTVQKVFENARDKAGIKKNVTVHSLRHSFETHLLEGV